MWTGFHLDWNHVLGHVDWNVFHGEPVCIKCQPKHDCFDSYPISVLVAFCLASGQSLRPTRRPLNSGQFFHKSILCIKLCVFELPVKCKHTAKIRAKLTWILLKTYIVIMSYYWENSLFLCWFVQGLKYSQISLSTLSLCEKVTLARNFTCGSRKYLSDIFP